VNPTYRDEAYARAKREIIEYARAHKGFRVFANGDVLPTEYEFEFSAPSFERSPVSNAVRPIIVHKVRLILPPDFPMKAPLVMWQTPIFHPNIHVEGKACLGMLEENYRPGLNFGYLCQMLVDMASFRNYTVAGVYNGDAAMWMLSPEGQQAIASIDGAPISERYVEDLVEWRAHGGLSEFPDDVFNAVIARLELIFSLQDVEREPPRKLEVRRVETNG
jgi:hypothetical protein